MEHLAVLHDMALFVEVARTGNFSRAATRLGVPGATLSRRIANLERALGVRLFDRTTRRVELSDAGQRYFARCAHLVDEALLAQQVLRDSAVAPTGHVRVTMPVDLGVFVIGPLLPEFARQFPGISFDLDLSPRHSDLVREHVDLAIRLGQVTHDSAVTRRIDTIAQALFAAPAYLERYGRPAEPADLARHECIVVRHSKPHAQWTLVRDGQPVTVGVHGRFMLNNQGLMRVLTERGMGIGALAPVLVREAVAQGRLEPLLSEWALPALPIQAVTASRLQVASVKALVDFLAARLAAG